MTVAKETQQCAAQQHQQRKGKEPEVLARYEDETMRSEAVGSWGVRTRGRRSSTHQAAVLRGSDASAVVAIAAMCGTTATAATEDRTRGAGKEQGREGARRGGAIMGSADEGVQDRATSGDAAHVVVEHRRQ